MSIVVAPAFRLVQYPACSRQTLSEKHHHNDIELGNQSQSKTDLTRLLCHTQIGDSSAPAFDSDPVRALYSSKSILLEERIFRI
jgi:hypothetical protein